MMNTRESAQWFLSERRIYSIPVPPEKKGPVTPQWNELRISSPQDFQKYFNGERQNLGVLTGPENLTDIDIDCLEAWFAWIEYALPTGMKWGHGELKPTHFLYRCDETPQSAKHNDPTMEDKGEATIIELRCQDKKGKCLQTIAPPSIHPSGEPIEFVGGAGFPGKAGSDDLQQRVRLTAVATMIGRHLRDGVCHDVFLALAGALCRAKWPLADAQRFVRAIFRAKWKEEANLGAANTEVSSTYDHFAQGGETTGLLKLGTLIDERIFRRMKQLLALESQEDWMHQQEAPQKPPRVLPKAYSLNSLRTLTIPGSEALIDQILVTPGLTLMVGASRSGKTVLAVQMGMCLANRVHLLDYYSTAQANTLIVEWDDRRGKASLKAFELKARASRGENQPFHYTVKEENDEDSLLDFTLSDPEFIPWLKGLIEEHQARFVILDSYTALRGFHENSKDIVKIEATELSRLNRLAIEMNCAFLLIHHTSKTAATQERHSRAAGSFAMQAVSEAQIVVERFRELGEEETARLVSVRGRHLRGLQMVLRFREESLDFDFLMEGPASEEFPRLRQLVRAFRDKAFSAGDVNTELGWAKTQVYAMMSRLMASGIVRKNGTSWSWEPGWKKTLDEI